MRKTTDLDEIGWQFNEAVALLREALTTGVVEPSLREEIAEGLPAIQAALGGYNEVAPVLRDLVIDHAVRLHSVGDAITNQTARGGGGEVRHHE